MRYELDATITPLRTDSLPFMQPFGLGLLARISSLMLRSEAAEKCSIQQQNTSMKSPTTIFCGFPPHMELIWTTRPLSYYPTDAANARVCMRCHGKPAV